MLIVHVFVHVKPEAVDRFLTVTRENARNSIREPGVVRFDVIQQEDDPTRFVLVEVYRSPQDPARHKEYVAGEAFLNLGQHFSLAVLPGEGAVRFVGSPW